MSNRTLAGVIGVLATAAIGGVIYYCLSRREKEVIVEEAQIQEVKKQQSKVFPSEITMEQMEADLEEFANRLPSKKRELFYEKYDKLQSDSFIPWLEDQKAVFKLNYIGVCLAFSLHTINRINKGEEHPDFDACIVETHRIFENLLDELTAKFQVLNIRNLKQTGMEVFGMIIEEHFEFDTSERQVAV